MSRLFGTDGIRGVANRDLSPELALRLGWATAEIVTSGRRKGKILIGRDTRLSGDLLEGALVAGILSAGIDVLNVGVIPTPAIAFLTQDFEADAGIVISASHNPATDNGIKFFNQRGFKFSSDEEKAIEELVFKETKSKSPIGREIGRTFDISAEAQKRYIEHVLQTVEGSLSGLKIALDCAHGAGYDIAPRILREIGLEVLPFNTKPDGTNINVKCGSTYPEYISRKVCMSEVDLGISLDGDADRAIAVDENGEVVDGDFIMAICADFLHRQGRLKKNKVVTTVMTNFGFDLAMQERGIEVVKTDVGDRYVLEKMIEENLNFGGEQSGHIIFLDHGTTGDGIITTLQLISVMKKAGSSLSKLKRIMKRWPQIMVNVKVRNKYQLNEKEKIWQEVSRWEEKLKGRGRIFLRPSGTEPVIRVTVESRDEKEANMIARQVAFLVKEELQ